MYHASFQASIDEAWRSMDPIRVGPTGGLQPQFIAVERDGSPVARIDAYTVSRGAFTDLIAWGRFVVLGWGDIVHLIDPASRGTRSIECAGYFGHLYPLDGLLLIGSASELLCVDARGDVVWKRDDLGIDGVIVHGVADGIVTGEGEWDPPGEWRKFRVTLATGERAT